MAKKSFNELTEKGQKQRLTKYQKEREARGTQETLARLVKPATIKDIKGENKLAVFRFAAYDKDSEETRFFTASAFIAKGKEKLEEFYANLTKGQLVAVEYKENNGYTNVYNLMDRSYADKSSKGNTGTSAQPEPEAELEV
ncbi:hypothetical protein HXA34_20670 [Salipaludibacillus agaradhaerens]|jgi:hypothetical protein|uniref:hypothetical protein n=1 Tax=Salipaludibacillus agaradhaerens TaxID=76935 RepID=UPI0021518CD1|nr:hypothetical protein [Salipaludibacillus agaradhaerens]MCR6108714.1 hypothetical protein [Salipaludibacillus agaradhaerens]MCR6120737.1 hypothetical protein [Salipaludibacillus agaradhaerens]